MFTGRDMHGASPVARPDLDSNCLLTSYSAECLSLWINSSTDFVSLDSGETSCGGTFICFGDAVPMANSIKLTA
ncbi:hypothetical protein MKX01_010897 [Papaver californicum]|nr:hypothetical protein MKX01_010897 [Papaver californicum]